MGDIQRIPWSDHMHPTVFSHLPWESNTSASLSGHRGYQSAKFKRDARSAINLCSNIATDSMVSENLFGYVLERQLERRPILVAPALAPGENSNALALSYAKWLASDMEWEFSSSIYKARSAKRDFITDPWYRIVAQPEFYGFVEPDRHYILVDDVFHMGGTLACLRGFIEKQGGHVIAVTTLGHGGFGNSFKLASAERLGLYDYVGLNEALLEEMGYGIDCLTAPEGEVLLRCASVDEVRAGLRRGRDACALRRD